jgi:hypothetical protein
MKNINQIKEDILDALEGKSKEICPNCECEFREGEHSIEMCKYLNR